MTLEKLDFFFKKRSLIIFCYCSKNKVKGSLLSGFVFTLRLQAYFIFSNLDAHTGKASSLPNEPSPQPREILLLTYVV